MSTFYIIIYTEIKHIGMGSHHQDWGLGITTQKFGVPNLTFSRWLYIYKLLYPICKVIRMTNAKTV